MNKMKLILAPLLAVLLAGPARGDTVCLPGVVCNTPDAGASYITFTDPVYDTCPAAPAPVTDVKEQAVEVKTPGDLTYRAIRIGAGWVLSDPARASRTACLMETCDVQREQLKQYAMLPLDQFHTKSWLWWGIGMAIAVAIGFTVGAIWTRLP